MPKTGDAYAIQMHEDGSCSVTLYGPPVWDEGEGARGDPVDTHAYTLPHIPYFDGIEENVRAHFAAWRGHAAAFEAQRAAMLEIVDNALALIGITPLQHAATKREENT